MRRFSEEGPHSALWADIVCIPAVEAQCFWWSQLGFKVESELQQIKFGKSVVAPSSNRCSDPALSLC